MSSTEAAGSPKGPARNRVAGASVLANVVLAGCKIVAGLAFHSASILAEGFHSFMDVFSSGIGYLGIRASSRPADDKHPYGHFKFEVLAGVLITLVLFLTGSAIVYEAGRSLLHPAAAERSWVAFGVMGFSAIANAVMS